MRSSSIRLSRLFLVTVFIFAVGGIADAYTLVLHGGKRIEVPDKFTLSQTALTYEISPGFSATVKLAAIDVPATERANNEAAGSFMRRLHAANTPRQAQTPSTQNRRSTRTITNQDLERFERNRLESEKAYEKRRQELGLPSLEESRRRAEQDAAELDEIIAKRRQAEAENYLREQTVQLQAQMATINARLNALDYQYAEPGYFYDSFAGFGPFNSGFGFGFRRRFPFAFNQLSPCGFNPSAACLQAFPFGFPHRRPIFVAPGMNTGRHFGGRMGGGVFVGPGARR